jgi:hypothetical protein
MSPSFSGLVALALRVNEILTKPACMAAMRRLAEFCLADPVNSRIDALEFPTNPGDGFDWTENSLARERWIKEYTVLTPEQTALVVAALHDYHCNGVEKVIVGAIIPSDPTAFDTDFADAATCRALRGAGHVPITANELGRRVRWERLLEWVRNAGDYSVFWFTLQVRRFESIVTADAKSSGKSKPKRKGTPPLEKRNPLKYQIYQRIEKERKAGTKRADILSLLKSDAALKEQLMEAGLKPSKKLVHAAIGYFSQPTCKKQETPPS